MTIFSSVEAAQQHGFVWLEYHSAVGLHVVVREFTRGDGRRERALAFAEPEKALA